MEQVHRDLRTLKKFDFIFLIIALFLIGAVLWIGNTLAELPSIERHIEQMGKRMDDHEARIAFIEKKIP